MTALPGLLGIGISALLNNLNRFISQNSADVSPIDVKFSERQSFYIVPVPGESPWVKEISFLVKESEYTSPITTSGQKRHLNEPTEVIHKKPKSTAMETNPNQVKPRKHFPLIEEENNDQKIGALLRVYDTVQTQLKINDIVEVYGILEHARLCDALPEDSCEPEEKCNEPLPRIHALIVHSLTHNNPLVCNNTSIISISKNVNDIQLIRIKLMQILTTLFNGDQIVAEYVLLHLISTR
ncbi:unnamed protein product [Schistosoma mattheei]|uniref:Mini-chromosome maintenance complex-binding protein n=1 Tax=Schistosoma mattheei TaxID=31246 RepID=A0A183P471_9TREM|nr:unnamed protein product [Schistosoma mattheei]